MAKLPGLGAKKPAAVPVESKKPAAKKPNPLSRFNPADKEEAEEILVGASEPEGEEDETPPVKPAKKPGRPAPVVEDEEDEEGEEDETPPVKPAKKPSRETTSADWFATGKEAEAWEERQRAARARSRRPEFFIKKDDPTGEAEVVFLDDAFVAYLEQHTIKDPTNPTGYTAVTCRKRMGVCELCKAATQPKTPVSMAGGRYVYRLVDLRGYTDREGKLHTGQFRFWVMPSYINSALIKFLSKTGKALSELKITCARTGTKKNINWQFYAESVDGQTKKKVAKATSVELPDFRTMYAPPTEEEIKTILDGAIEVDDMED